MKLNTRTTTTSPRLQKMQAQSSALFARTAGIFENFFCCAGPHAVDDDARSYTFPEIPTEDDDDEYADDDVKSFRIKQSSSASTSEKAIANTDSFSSKNSGGIVFLDAMEPRVRPILRLPASASIRTATTASMTSATDTIPSIQGSQTFDSECSIFSSSTAARPPRSISSVTTAKCGPRRPRSSDDESIRRVQTEVMQLLPALSATDGYRC